MTRTAGYLLARGTAERLPLASGSVDMVCCSPPYFNLRSYQGVDATAWPPVTFRPMPGIDPVAVPSMVCTLGNEPDPLSYVAHMVLIGREIRRVMRDHACWILNISDSYCSTAPGTLGDPIHRNGIFSGVREETAEARRKFRSETPPGLKPKDLIGIPWRVAFALQADGFLLRSAPPWIKPDNAMPESVTSRPGTAHEMIFILAKSDRYYWDADATRRGNKTAPHARQGKILPDVSSGPLRRSNSDGTSCCQFAPEKQSRIWGTEAGRNWRTADIFMDALDECIAYHRGRVAELEAARDRGGLIVGGNGDAEAILANPQSFKGAHFATWGGRLISPFIRAATSEAGHCSACGRGWRRVVELGELKPLPTSGTYSARTDNYAVGPMDRGGNHQRLAGSQMCFREKSTLGWSPVCSCAAPPRPAVVLDPFGGSMSTVVAALALGRDAIGIDASADYLALARRRLERPHAAVSAPAAKSPAPLPLFPEDAP